MLHPDVAAKLGHFDVYSGGGRHLNLDRAFVRDALDKLTAGTGRLAHACSRVHLFGPFQVLQGGLVLVDAPGTGDPVPLHRKQLDKACALADHIILTAQKSLEEGEPLEALLDNQTLRRFLDANAKPVGLSILHTRRVSPGSNDAGSDDGAVIVKQKSQEELVTKLMEVADELADERPNDEPITLDFIRKEVERRVQIIAVYPLKYAGLMMNPNRTALESSDLLEEKLRRTGGTAALGLLEGMTLGRVLEIVEGIELPLRAALTGLSAQRVQPTEAAAICANGACRSSRQLRSTLTLP